MKAPTSPSLLSVIMSSFSVLFLTQLSCPNILFIFLAIIVTQNPQEPALATQIDSWKI